MTPDPEITSPILDELLSTPYACSSLSRLSGGTANFVYRGTLRVPLDDPAGTSTVILKHAEEFLAGFRDFKLTADRCLVEEDILNVLKDFPPITATTTSDSTTGGKQGKITIKTPHLYHFSHATHTQVQEDLPAAQDLKTFLTTPTIATTIPETLVRSIGNALGEWLLAFHRWTDEHESSRRELKMRMAGNTLMRELKCSVNYDNLVQTVERYPGLLEGCRGVFEEVRDFAKEECKRKHVDGEGFGVIHGDFWSGNVLLQQNFLQQKPPTPTLFITDWELAQCGPRALDLGQMIAELYQIKHFKGFDAAIWLIQAFVEGYRPALTDDIAFRTAVHVGVHFVAWGSTIPGWGTEEQVEDVVRLGRDFVVKGWEKDRTWFVERTALGCLFKGLNWE